ncbi:MAG: DUF2155 domain-containing protein [Pseudomonadota bacterium]
MIRRALALAAIVGLATTPHAAAAMTPYDTAKVRGLDKITGNATDFVLNTGQTMEFGGISLTLRACHQAPPEDPPEAAAFLEIISNRKDPTTGESLEEDPRLFSGWMFASSPGLNALEHPVYDVWVINCTTVVPDIIEGAAENSAE